MQLLLFALALALVDSAKVPLHPLSDEFINEINSKQTSWIAGRNYDPDTPLEFLRQRNGFLGVHPDPNYIPPVLETQLNFSAFAIPQSFDARKSWPECDVSLNRIRDQGRCGSCWAFAATESISDRICIHSKGKTQIEISPEDLLSCCTTCGNCKGGYMMSALDFWVQHGLVSGGDYRSDQGCRPYTEGPFERGITPTCTRTCRTAYRTTYPKDKHFGKKTYVVPKGIANIQHDLITNGPLIVNFMVYEDFHSYKSGVYHHVQGRSTGNHVVKLMGWGEERGIPYWLIANSWGARWGADKGFFKIRRGNNECGIENFPYAALP